MFCLWMVHLDQHSHSGITSHRNSTHDHVPPVFPLYHPPKHRLFSNEKLTGALKNMCTNLFPSFSQSQLTNGALDGSAYASGFSEACKQFSPALQDMSPETWYLVFGLPIGGLTLGGLSMCLAVLPSCGNNNGKSLKLVFSTSFICMKCCC